jgi:hypothetical protein
MHSAPPPRSIIKSPSPSPSPSSSLSHLPPDSTCRDRIQSSGFRVFDPTTDSSFRRILLERRKLAEPDLEATSDADADASSANPNPKSLESNEPGEVEIQGEQDRSCVSKPLLRRGDASPSPEVVEEAEVEPESVLGIILKEEESISTADQINPVGDDSAPAIAEVEAIRTAGSAMASNLPSNASVPGVIALDENNGSSESYQQGNAGDAVRIKPRINNMNVEDSEKTIIATRDSAPSMEAMAKPAASVEALHPENAMEADRRAKRIWTRGMNHESIDYTCGSLMDVRSLRRIKCAVDDACRKAAAASARALAQARNKLLIPAANTVSASLSVFLHSHSCVRSSAQAHAKRDGEENVSFRGFYS